MKLPRLFPQKYSGSVFRNIFTCSPTQHLYDDIAHSEDFGLVDAFVQSTSEIDHHIEQIRRPFQYGDLSHEILQVFAKHQWRRGRFGDGREYGVWYGAEEEITSTYEASYWAFQLGKDNVQSKGEVYTSDRKMYRAELHSEKCADLFETSSYFHQLIHPADPSFCHALGLKIKKEGIEMIRTPSARRVSGHCIPVFTPNAIQNASFIYYLKIYCNPDGQITTSSSQSELNLRFNFEDLQNPYEIA